MRFFLSLFTVLLLLPQAAEAKRFTYSQIHRMPKSVEKDYYIWRFLCQGNCTSSQAKAIIKDLNSVNSKLRSSYHKKTGLPLKVKSHNDKKVPDKRAREAWLAKVLSHKYFDTAIKRLQQGRRDLAILYFEKSRLSAKKQSETDKAIFWLYKTTGERRYLSYLLKSWDVNFYTLLARDEMHIKYPKTITPKLPRKSLRHYRESDPIAWAQIKKKLFKSDTNLDKLANNYMSEESVGIYTYIRTEASKKRSIYYPMPYRDTISQYPKERQALLYAIARQESRFVPASVSRSFALGMMQIMPFLVKHIAKERGERVDLDDMFNPNKAIVYANHHLDYLTAYLYHPLFIAYAYNGGIGFTKRLLQSQKYFRSGAYEPYLSIEKIDNAEAREYGKKVLVNYIIYLNKLGIPSRISNYIKVLTTPSKTDRFR